MITPAGYIGAVFTLLLTLLGIGGVFFLLLGNVQGTQDSIITAYIAFGLIALISGSVVVVNDWPKIWRKLLTGKQ